MPPAQESSRLFLSDAKFCQLSKMTRWGWCLKSHSHDTPVPTLLHCLGHWLLAGLPRSPTRMKEAMGMQHVLGLSLLKDGRACPNPTAKPSCSFPPAMIG